MEIRNVVHRGLRRFIERDEASGMPAPAVEKVRNIAEHQIADLNFEDYHQRGLFMNAMVTSGAPPHPALSPSGGEGTAHGPLSLGRERAGVRVRLQFPNYSG
jgi:hypothetical protein